VLLASGSPVVVERGYVATDRLNRKMQKLQLVHRHPFWLEPLPERTDSKSRSSPLRRFVIPYCSRADCCFHERRDSFRRPPNLPAPFDIRSFRCIARPRDGSHCRFVSAADNFASTMTPVPQSIFVELLNPSCDEVIGSLLAIIGPDSCKRGPGAKRIEERCRDGETRVCSRR
jgi:hypothetical protein